MTIEPMRSRRRAPDELAALFAGGWPAFITADADAEGMLPRIRAQFADLEIAAIADGVLVGAAWAVPIRWNATVDDLPGGYTQSLTRALAVPDAAGPPDTLVICAAQVRPDWHSRGVAVRLITGLLDVASDLGLNKAVAPLRPTAKSRYPLSPIRRYAGWVRPDGTPFDPWLRTHLRLGATLLGPAPESQVMTGTVEQWTGWTGLLFPDSGEYVIPDGLATLHIDLGADTGRYGEPGIWVRHR